MVKEIPVQKLQDPKGHHNADDRVSNVEVVGSFCCKPTCEEMVNLSNGKAEKDRCNPADQTDQNAEYYDETSVTNVSKPPGQYFANDRIRKFQSGLLLNQCQLKAD